MAYTEKSFKSKSWERLYNKCETVRNSTHSNELKIMKLTTIAFKQFPNSHSQHLVRQFINSI